MSEDRDEAEGTPPPDQESYDAADPRAVRRARQAAQLRKDQLRDWVGRLLAEPLSRSFMFDVLRDFKLFDENFSEAVAVNHGEQAWYVFGQRESGLRLFQLLLAQQPELAARMIAENTHN